MHDTVRELAISLSIKENFCLLYEDNNPANIEKKFRRLSIIKSSNNIGDSIHLPLLRSLMSFDLSMHSSPLVTTNFLECRYLSVLNLENLSIKSVPNNIGHLFNLHYLGLRNTKVKLLPKSIEKLHNLQTLDLYRSEIQELPRGIVQLTKLRHLFVEAVIDNTYMSFQSHSGTHLHKAMFSLKDLQTIQAVQSNAMVVRELGNLTQLRSLRILNVREHQSKELCKSLYNMSFLSFLQINANNENEILHLEGLDLQRIQKLVLYGRLQENILQLAPVFQIYGEGIQTLSLGWSQLQNDPLLSLSHLRNLTCLNLIRAYEGQQLVFMAGWFPQLKHLELRQMPNLVNVVMEQGTMMNVEEIFLRELKQLVGIPKGMEYLVSLKGMACLDMLANFRELAKGRHQLFHFVCIVR